MTRWPIQVLLAAALAAPFAASATQPAPEVHERQWHKLRGEQLHVTYFAEFIIAKGKDEAGDECGLDDIYDMDTLEARQLGVALDEIDGIQPRLA